MRVLVEQTERKTRDWIKRLAGHGHIDCDVPVYVLMGGEEHVDWDIHPERETIIIGTQDMLLSRALNRGYAASRARWPMLFGLLNTDCLWVFDEIQLMGAGLATTAQLEAFRRLLPQKDVEPARNGHGCRSVWMSATMRKDWLKTVDFAPRVDELAALELTDEDHRWAEVRKRWNGRKPLTRAMAAMGDADELAEEICAQHRPGTRTIVVVNTVKRACELHRKIKARYAGLGALQPTPRIVLLHSRFRPHDRDRQIEEALRMPAAGGTIVVSTQVIEAGVDVSATTLFTELAPWASLVQRFGRCNRRGDDDDARVFWVDLPADVESTKKGTSAAPYELEDLHGARGELKKLSDVGLSPLSKSNAELTFEHGHVLRRKDLIELFDTTPDLAGNDIDIDRFVREIDETDVRVFWRAWDQPNGNEPPSNDEPKPRREELCPAPFGEFRTFARDEKRRNRVWRWNFLDRKWEPADPDKIVPGQVFLVHADAGGYSSQNGWTGNPKDEPPIDVAPAREDAQAPDSNEDDALSLIGEWQAISDHARDVCRELESITETLSLADGEADALRFAARWHDRGKAHEVFRSALPANSPDATQFWAKAPRARGARISYSRRHFRHELASALAVLMAPVETVSEAERDLVAYLVAAHHGKVRLSIRSLPNERRPEDKDRERRFARGVWDDDVLPETSLGDGVIAPEVTLSLEPMGIGLCEEPPFEGQPSWMERMLRLRDELGPFRLAYLEAILRAADMRASRDAEERAKQKEADHD